jgi:hypothetical protein
MFFGLLWEQKLSSLVAAREQSVCVVTLRS